MRLPGDVSGLDRLESRSIFLSQPLSVCAYIVLIYMYYYAVVYAFYYDVRVYV